MSPSHDAGTKKRKPICRELMGTMMTLQEIITRRAELKSEHSKAAKAWEDHNAAFKSEMQSLAGREKMIVGGLDTDLVDAGYQVIFIEGRVSDVRHGAYSDQRRSKVRTEAVEDAMRRLADGGVKLLGEYVGVKNFEHFGDQREDHQYFMGPRHGSIVFAIGLRRTVRNRLCEGGELTQDEINSALYVLSALREIEAMRAEFAA